MLTPNAQEGDTEDVDRAAEAVEVPAPK